MSLENLKRKYSWGPIPQWELDALKPAKADEPKKTRKTAKEMPSDGNSSADRD